MNKTMSGFTLIEILIVVVILGILGAGVVPNILSRPDTARVQAAQTDLRALSQTLEIYRLDNFQYPSSEQGLESLIDRPSGFPEPKNWNPEGYLKKLPTDPWGSPYLYEKAGSSYSLIRSGAAGQAGGEGFDADIRLNDL